MAYILPQYLPSTSGDVRDIQDIAEGVVAMGNEAPSLPRCRSGDTMFSNKGVLLSKGRGIVDGVDVNRFLIQGRLFEVPSVLISGIMEQKGPERARIAQSRLFQWSSSVISYARHIKNGLSQ
ncbi:MAG TPA: hypothetical protein G4O03_04655 [Dehalococcoidia bacterium]|nr:hypothetical protein [Dehalococcoidia bacterium]